MSHHILFDRILFGRLVLSAVMLMLSFQAQGYDFKADNDDGKSIYYNVLSTNTVEVTFQKRFAATSSYAGSLSIPATVQYDGKSYKVSAIGDRAFFYCRDLEDVDIPNQISEIGRWAFAWCDGLQSVRMPASLSSVRADAFDGCYSLESIDAMGAAFQSVDGALFSGDLSSLLAFPLAYVGKYEIPDGTTHIGDHAFGGCSFLSEVSIPESVTAIGPDAFYFCNWLREVRVPSSVSEIGTGAFGDCSSLSAIYVSPKNDRYSAYDGVLYNKDRTTLLQCPGAASATVEIPASVLTVGPQSFFRNLGITDIQLPEGVHTVGDAAFLDCNALAAIQIPSTTREIKSMALAMCPSLSSVYVAVPDPSMIKMGDEVFAETDLGFCSLVVPVGAAAAYKSAPQWRNFKNIYEVDMLLRQSVEWPSDVDTLGPNAKSVFLNATSSSGLPVKYRISPESKGYGYIKGDSLYVTEPGEIVVTAYQPGDSRYYPAPSVNHIFYRPMSYADEPALIPVKVYGSIGKIIVSGADSDAVIRVYSITGVQVCSTKDREIPVASKGLYVVVVSGRSYKVMVR